jgi:hypothetical protein
LGDLDLVTGDPEPDLERDLDFDFEIERDALRDLPEPTGDRDVGLDLTDSLDSRDCDRDRDFLESLDAASE